MEINNKMEINQDLLWKNLRDSLRNLEAFILDEQVRARKRGIDPGDRDELFLTKARAAVTSVQADKLRDLMDEIRGLSQYFGYYCQDTDKLDKLVEAFYENSLEAVSATKS